MNKNKQGTQIGVREKLLLHASKLNILELKHKVNAKYNYREPHTDACFYFFTICGACKYQCALWSSLFKTYNWRVKAIISFFEAILI